MNHGIFENSCIFISLSALNLFTRLRRNQRMLPSLAKEKKCLQSRHADGQVQGQKVAWKVSTHFNGLWSAISSLQIFMNHDEGMNFERSTQSLTDQFHKKYDYVHEEVSYVLAWDFLKILLPRGKSPTPVMNIVIYPVRFGKYNPCLIFLLFFMSC